MIANRLRATGVFGALSVLTLLFASCSMIVSEEPGASFSALSGRSDESIQDGNRLLVKGRDGNIYTLDPDGSNAIALTGDASDTRQYLQPSWSPTADQIAWTSTSLVDGRAESALIVADGGGRNRTEYDVPFPPFYIYWSPNGSQLAYLSSWSSSGRPSMALRLVDLRTSGDPVRTLAEGQPLYLSWAPSGEQVLTHIENERIEMQQLDGTRKTLRESATSFPAPLWFPSSDRLLYAVAEGESQQLIVTGLDGGLESVVTDFEGSISFTLSPDESRIAYTVTPISAGLASFGPLFSVEVDGGATRQLSELPVIAYFWSPDAAKLAFLAVDQQADPVRLRWRIWDGSQTEDYDAILPSQTFLERYLAFFDQYAQSMSIWSPDSSAFTYAGIGQDNRDGIWVQEIDSETPKYVGPGVFASWSPR